jgi:vitamin B12 transporter
MRSAPLSAAIAGPLLICLSGFTSLAGAAPLDQPAVLEQVIVTATRSAEGLPSNVLGSSITVLSSATLGARQTRVVSDVLRDVPGVSVNRNGTVGGLTQVRIRGTESNHVLTLIDGIEASDPFQGEFDYATLIADEIARVEILRGQQGALYGSDAIGGVIHYLTASGSDAPGFRTRIEGGSFGTYEASARFAAATDTLDYAISGGFQNTEGVSTARFGNRDVGSENTAVSARLGYAPTENLRLRAVARYTYTDAELNDQDFSFGSPTFGFAIDSDDDYRNAALYGLVSGELAAFDERWVNTLSVQGVDAERRNFSGGQRDFSNQGSRVKASWVSTLRFGERFAQSLTFAADFEREEMQNISPNITAAQGIERKTDNTGFVAEYEVVIDDRIGFGAAVRHDDNERFDDADTYKVQASYAFPSDTRLRAAAGSGIKNPSIFELFGFDPDFFVGNPNLEPERSEGWEIGIEQGFAERRVLVGATYFDSTLRDEIFTTFTPPTFVAAPRNRSTRSTQNGVEVFVSARLGGSWNVDASYTDLNAKEDGVEESRRPSRLASLNLAWRTPSNRAGVNLSARYNGETLDSNFTGVGPARITLDEYTLVNLGADFSLNERTQLYGRIENLFDEDYEEVFTFRASGRGAYAGVRLAF